MTFNCIALFNLSSELLIIFGLLCTIQKTTYKHCTTVKTIVLWNSQWKATKLQVSVKINNGGTLTLVDSNILNKKDVLWTPKNFVFRL